MMTVEEVQTKVETLSLPLLVQAGIDLVELQIGRNGKDVSLRIFADRPTGGITIGECARLNRSIVEAIDADGFLGDAYELEFSSPGLDRPLFTHKDFARNLNRPVRVCLKEPIEGKKEYTGILAAVDGQTLTVHLKKKNTVVLPLACIEKGLLVI